MQRGFGIKMKFNEATKYTLEKGKVSLMNYLRLKD